MSAGSEPGEPLEVRLARPEDVALLPAVELAAGERFRAIGLDAIADDAPPLLDELDAHVQDGSAWVATLGGTVVGYALASTVDHEGHLDQVSVVPDATGRGIGRALVEVVCRWALDQGHDAVTLTTFRDVAWNGPLYEHLGFEPLGAEDLGPELAAIRRQEQERGVEVAPRTAMRRRLDGSEEHPRAG